MKDSFNLMCFSLHNPIYLEPPWLDCKHSQAGQGELSQVLRCREGVSEVLEAMECFRKEVISASISFPALRAGMRVRKTHPIEIESS